MKIKTDKLLGPALDWAVAKSEEWEPMWDEVSEDFFLPGCPECTHLREFNPSSIWAQGGPIIDRENITIIRCDDDFGVTNGFCNNVRIPVWAAEHGVQHSTYESYEGEYYDPQYEIEAEDCFYGATPLISAMRCYVANKLGPEVDVPKELVTSVTKDRNEEVTFSRNGDCWRPEEILDSEEIARRIAAEKGSFEVVKADGVYSGVLMGETNCHVVLSLGRSALIVEKSDREFCEGVKQGDELTVTIKDGIGEWSRVAGKEMAAGGMGR